MKIVNPDYTVEKIVERMKEAARRAYPSAAAEPGFFADESPTQTMSEDETHNLGSQLDLQQVVLQPAFYPSPTDQYHVNDLLKFNGRAFLHNAYQALLKRPPDEVGYSGFMADLHSGRLNKIDVLARIRYSPEGRANKVQVKGLFVPAALRTAYSVPFLGYLLNLMVAVLRLPLMLRAQRELEAHVLAQQEIIVEHLNHLGRTLRLHANRVGQLLSAQVESIERVRGDIEQRLSSLREEQETNQGVVLNRVGELTSYLEERINDEAAQRQADLWSLGKRLGELTSEWREELSQTQDILTQAIASQSDRIARLHESGEALAASTASLITRTDSLLTQANLLNQRVDSLTQSAAAETNRVRGQLAMQNQRLMRLLDEVGKQLPEHLEEEQLQTIAKERASFLDDFYAFFDEQFRGSREGIKERLRVYLPYLQTDETAGTTAPLLDVGSGRGEWLELLQEQGVDALGVDSNGVLITACRERGLKVVQDDLLNHLGTLGNESLSAITGFHIVEHLSLEVLVKFLNESMRVLQPGRPIILETPNPRNVLVGSCNFYFDPTHRNPLPSEVLKFLVESRGFMRVEILPLNPSDQTPVPGNSELVNRFNQYFYGPMDYGLVGWKAPVMDNGQLTIDDRR